MNEKEIKQKGRTMTYARKDNILVNLNNVKTITINGKSIFFNYEESNPIQFDFPSEIHAGTYWARIQSTLSYWARIQSTLSDNLIKQLDTQEKKGDKKDGEKRNT